MTTRPDVPNHDYAQVASDPSRVRTYADALFALNGEDSGARLLMACADEITRLTKQRDELWMLLDHIDTLDDSCRSDSRAFREAARRQQKKRFAIHNPDETSAKET